MSRKTEKFLRLAMRALIFCTWDFHRSKKEALSNFACLPGKYKIACVVEN